MITAAPDTTLMDGRPVCIVYAHELVAGDVIVKHESINLDVIGVRNYGNWVVADYSCTAGTGSRSYFRHSYVAIEPRSEQEAH